MSPRALLVSLVGGAVVGAGVAPRRYRRDLDDAYARLAAVDRRVISTALGAVEYAERGAGQPLLISHGIFHGCDGGLHAARDLTGERRSSPPHASAISGRSCRSTPAAPRKPTRSSRCSTTSTSTPSTSWRSPPGRQPPCNSRCATPTGSPTW